MFVFVELVSRPRVEISLLTCPGTKINCPDLKSADCLNTWRTGVCNVVVLLLLLLLLFGAPAPSSDGSKIARIFIHGYHLATIGSMLSARLTSFSVYI